MNVGFIGLGSMGAGMSRNLLKAGHDLIVYNRTRSRVEEMRESPIPSLKQPLGWKRLSQCWLTIAPFKM